MANNNNQRQNALMEAAVLYAERGWPVLPLHTIKNGECTCSKKSECPHAGKHPHLPNGVKGATTDKDMIVQWWTQWPDANIGIATGEKSFDVLDVDVKGDGKSVLEKLEVEHGKLPDTPRQKTGSGGGQYFFKYSGKVKNPVRFLPGLDARSNGGYVVAPPSKHYSGGTYEWEEGKSPTDLQFVDMPEWLIALIGNSNNKKTETPPIEQEIAAGGRNDALFKLGCSMRARGLHIEEIGPTLRKVNERRCKPPLAQDEVEAIIKNVEKYQQRPMVVVGFSNGKPEIDAKNLNVQAVAKQAWDALVKSNNPSWLFRQDWNLVHVAEDEGVHSIRSIDDPRLRYFVTRAANWFVKNGDDKILVRPPAFVIEDMLAEPNPPLPKLNRLIECPIFAPGGILHSAPGYSELTRCYLSLPSGLVIPDVAASPSPEDVVKACRVMENLFWDFPFAGDSERVMAFSLFILPFARELISGGVPIYLVEAPAQGTGKTLLANVAAYSALGHELPAVSGRKSDEEFDKLITSILSRSPSVVFLDNLTGTLNSSTLAAALTSSVWEGRILGTSQTVRLPARCIWIITANNLQLSTELARRSVRIRLDAKMDRPWDREPSNFRHSSIIGWARGNRGELIWAALTMIQNWLSKGRPNPVGIKPIGGFEIYSHVIGGILQCAGISGFLGNMEDFYNASDRETEIFRSFVAVWWQDYQDQEVGAAQLYPLVDKYEIPLELGNSGNDRGRKTRFGKILASLRDRQIGNYRISIIGSKDRAKQYRLTLTAESPNPAVVNESTRHSETDMQTDSPSRSSLEDDKSHECVDGAGGESFPLYPSKVETVNPTIAETFGIDRCSWTDALREIAQQ